MPTYERPMQDFPITDNEGVVLGRMMLPERIIGVLNEVRPPINLAYSIGKTGLNAFTLTFPPMVVKSDAPQISGQNATYVSCPEHEPFDVDCHACLVQTVGHLITILNGAVDG